MLLKSECHKFQIFYFLFQHFFWEVSILLENLGIQVKHQKIEEGCGCNGHEGACKCKVKEEVVSEGPDEIKKSKKGLLKLQKAETKFRDKMFELEQIILQDPTMGNLKLARRIKDSYKSGVTKFMREATSIVKKIK